MTLKPGSFVHIIFVHLLVLFIGYWSGYCGTWTRTLLSLISGDRFDGLRGFYLVDPTRFRDYAGERSYKFRC